MFHQILDTIRAYDTIILHRHTNPDGDALGSQIGMKHILKANFPEKRVFAVGDGAGRYSFMTDCIMDVIPDSEYQGALAIILDTSAPHLISDDRYKLAEKTVRMDHHLFCGQIADIEVVQTSFESCCGLVTEFALQSQLALTPIAAQSLYTGMVTDSGRFRYDSTTSKTFYLASKLLEQPFDVSAIYASLYADDYSRIRRRAEFVLKIQFTKNNVAYIYTTQEEAAALGMDTFSISRGMVGTMADIRGVDIWVNFTETDTGVLCELRSGKYNINPIAVKYGGGGHAKASGACVSDRAAAMAMLEDLDKMMEDAR